MSFLRLALTFSRCVILVMVRGNSERFLVFFGTTGICAKAMESSGFLLYFSVFCFAAGAILDYRTIPSWWSLGPLFPLFSPGQTY